MENIEIVQWAVLRRGCGSIRTSPAPVCEWPWARRCPVVALPHTAPGSDGAASRGPDARAVQPWSHGEGGSGTRGSAQCAPWRLGQRGAMGGIVCQIMAGPGAPCQNVKVRLTL